jgi:hypothetical protein
VLLKSFALKSSKRSPGNAEKLQQQNTQHTEAAGSTAAATPPN